VSRVVQLILEAELVPARGLNSLVERVLEPGITRYQFLDALLELSSAIAKLRDVSSDSIFQRLNSAPRADLSREIDLVLGRKNLRAVA
jgi:hypothetical protein